MKKEFDFLASDKEPFFYVEYGKIKQHRGLVYLHKSTGEKESIPIASIMSIFMGPGTSITHDAARLCAEQDCYISIVNGGSNVHSIWHAGRWAKPDNLTRQVLAFSNPKKKLQVAKKLLEQKFKSTGQVGFISDIKNVDTSASLLSLEAVAAKRNYRNLAEERGISFTRDRKSIEGVNGRVSLLSNLVYHYMTTVCYIYGYNPSLGFLHGLTRRGGLAFDLADTVKQDLVLIPSFDGEGKDPKTLMYNLSEQLKRKRSNVFKGVGDLLDKVL